MRLVKGDTGSRIDDEVMQAAEAMGLQVDAASQQSGGLEVWPENESTVKVFIAMGTQWNVGMAGAIGLRYEALPVVMKLTNVPPAERASVFAGLRLMERAALEEFSHGR